MQEALPRWTATASRWRKNDVDRGSWLTSESRRPISETSSMACWPQTPDDSMATGMKSTLVLMSWYLWSFFSSASVAAEPAFLLLASTYDCAYVLGQVASQARQRPLFHGTWVAPSGFLSLRPQSECYIIIIIIIIIKYNDILKWHNFKKNCKVLWCIYITVLVTEMKLTFLSACNYDHVICHVIDHTLYVKLFVIVCLLVLNWVI